LSRELKVIAHFPPDELIAKNRQEAVQVYFKVQFRYFPEETRKTTKRLKGM
jgi:hypothetical protein